MDARETYYLQDIRRKALREAYRLVAQYVTESEAGDIVWKGRAAQCLTRLRVLADRPAELVPFGKDEAL